MFYSSAVNKKKAYGSPIFLLKPVSKYDRIVISAFECILPSNIAGLTNAYFNLSTILREKNSAIQNAFYDDNKVIRTIAVGKKFNVLTAVLYPNMNKTVINFTVIAGPVNRTREVNIKHSLTITQWNRP